MISRSSQPFSANRCHHADFGRGSCSPASCVALRVIRAKGLCDLGLLESTAPAVPGWRIARFGAEVQADLWLALMVCQSAENIPRVLAQHGLVPDCDSEISQLNGNCCGSTYHDNISPVEHREAGTADRLPIENRRGYPQLIGTPEHKGARIRVRFKEARRPPPPGFLFASGAPRAAFASPYP
jgi:hypothetical protein